MGLITIAYKFSFSVFWQAARFAEEKMTPVLLDF